MKPAAESCIAVLVLLTCTIPTGAVAQADATADEFMQADAEDQNGALAPPTAQGAAGLEATQTPAEQAVGEGAQAVQDPPTGALVAPSGYATGGGETYVEPAPTPVFVVPTTTTTSRRARPAALPNMIVVDPLAAAQGLVVLQYGRAMGRHWSFLLGPEVLVPGVLADGVRGGGIVGSVTFHFLRDAPAGLWLGPRFELLVLRNGPDRGLGGLIGGYLGYTWQWGHFTLSLGAGASYAKLVVNGRVVLEKVLPIGRSALGVAF